MKILKPFVVTTLRAKLMIKTDWYFLFQHSLYLQVTSYMNNLSFPMQLQRRYCINVEQLIVLPIKKTISTFQILKISIPLSRLYRRQICVRS